MTRDIKLDHAGMKAMLKSAEVRAELRRRADQVKAHAESIAPEATGEYKRSFVVADDTTDRAVVRVGNKAPHALIVEARDRVLGRSIDAAGN